jgi:hypothetical protein
MELERHVDGMGRNFRDFHVEPWIADIVILASGRIRNPFARSDRVQTDFMDA